MNILDQNFAIKRFGLDVGLVYEADAEFIYNIRSDKHLTRFIHEIEGDVSDQIAWLKKYKERERNGIEYYFIYRKNGKPIGVNRIYGIKNAEGTTGSWICAPGTNPIDTLATCIILYDIFFDIIELNRALFDTRKDNISALKVNKALGGILLYETDLDFYFELLSDNYHEKRESLIKTWHLK